MAKRCKYDTIIFYRIVNHPKRSAKHYPAHPPTESFTSNAVTAKWVDIATATFPEKTQFTLARWQTN